jgi:hypothetical protein
LTEPKPFIKWVGGKRKLVPEIVARMPKSFGAYHEPFMGGAALFWHLRPTIAQNDDASVAFLNEPAAGAYPVMAVGAQACMPVPTTPAPAETFTDPVPAPTVPGA